MYFTDGPVSFRSINVRIFFVRRESMMMLQCSVQIKYNNSTVCIIKHIIFNL